MPARRLVAALLATAALSTTAAFASTITSDTLAAGSTVVGRCQTGAFTYAFGKDAGGLVESVTVYAAAWSGLASRRAPALHERKGALPARRRRRSG